MRKSEAVVFIFVILISLLFSVSLGFIAGSQQTPDFQKTVVALNRLTTVTLTMTTDSDMDILNGTSLPIQSKPFEFSLFFGPSSTTWYVPIIFIGAGTTSQLDVNYECSGFCTANRSSIRFYTYKQSIRDLSR